MIRITNASLTWRLSLAFGAVLLAMAAGTVVGLLGLRAMHDAATSAIDSDVRRAQLAADLRILILTARRYEKDAFITIDVAKQHAGYREKWTANQAAFVASLDQMRSLPLAADDKDAVDTLARANASYRDGFLATLATIDKGQIGTAEDANRHFETHKQAVREMEAASASINERAVKAVAALHVPMAERYRHTVSLQVLFALACLVAAGGLGFAVRRSITRQLGGEPAYAMDVARRIAGGDLSGPIELAPGDRGSLLAAMAQMQTNLNDTVRSIRASSAVIAERSSEIADGNADLSRRTDSQSSNLRQTTSSMELLTSSVAENASIARDAVGLADQTRQAVDACGGTVGQVVTTMERISGSSRQIAEIVGVIDGIAFQTNILALNAAVEAARAGEQGRGFAVVAGEVRTLASRSADAAREIKQLIETSVGQVHAGADHVREAGEATGRIVEQFHRVASMLQRISQATDTQTSGIAQVGQAVSELDEVTQQNAALASQSSATASVLQQQADQLVRVVGSFTIAGAR